MVGISTAQMPLLPNGVALQLRTTIDCGLLGGVIWPAAATLCNYLKNNYDQLPVRLDQSSCVELGAGTGAVGLFAAGLGTKQVVLTDCRPGSIPGSETYTTDCTRELPLAGSSCLLDLLKSNVDANIHHFDDTNTPRLQAVNNINNENLDMLLSHPRSRQQKQQERIKQQPQIQVMELDWTNHLHADKVRDVGPSSGFDLVIASDVTHFTAMHEPLVSTILSLLNPDSGVSLFSHEKRLMNLKEQDTQLEAFQNIVNANGLSIQFLDPTTTVAKPERRDEEGNIHHDHIINNEVLNNNKNHYRHSVFILTKQPISNGLVTNVYV